MFVHLHVHSNYSFLRGLAAPADLAQMAARLDIPALALTDYQGMSGAIEFYTACQAQRIHPVLGLELIVKTLPEISHTSVLRAVGAINTLEAAAQIGRRVRVAGVRQSWRRS